MNDCSKLPYIIAVDFDGTLCENEYPNIGAPKDNVITAVKQYHNFGWKIVLWTCRNGNQLLEAIEWCEEHGLKFDAVNCNIPEVQQEFGGDTRKVFANVYLDDRNVLLKSIPDFIDNGCIMLEDNHGCGNNCTKQHH